MTKRIEMSLKQREKALSELIRDARKFKFEKHLITDYEKQLKEIREEIKEIKKKQKKVMKLLKIKYPVA